MKWLLGTYTSRFNRRHKLFGHLFSGRYKSMLVDGSGNGYLKSVCDYVHLNPAWAKLLSARQKLCAYGDIRLIHPELVGQLLLSEASGFTQGDQSSSKLGAGALCWASHTRRL